MKISIIELSIVERSEGITISELNSIITSPSAVISFIFAYKFSPSEAASSSLLMSYETVVTDYY